MAHSNDSVQMEHLWTNARLATMADGELGLIDNGAVAAAGGRIVYAGPAEDAPKTAEKVHDIGGRLITPA
jgi:imidazolonepropionase